MKKFDDRKFVSLKRNKRQILRTLIKQQSLEEKDIERGRVIVQEGRSYLVESIDDPSRSLAQCVISGTVSTENLDSTILVVGDYVSFKRDGSSISADLDSGKILNIEKRESFLSRKDLIKPQEDIIAANIEKLIIFCSAAEPFYNTRLIDRYIIAAEIGSLEPVICVNKMDLVDSQEAEVKEDLDVYRKLGIKLFFISALNKSNFEPFFNYISKSSSVLSGPSGCGKSTLINSVFGKELQKINEISEKWNKGTHTTSSIKLFKFQQGGEIIDTPGIREFAIWGLIPSELHLYFHEFDDYSPQCRYVRCTHIHEPDCAVLKALEDGQISYRRYESYLNIYSTIEDK